MKQIEKALRQLRDNLDSYFEVVLQQTQALKELRQWVVAMNLKYDKIGNNFVAYQPDHGETLHHNDNWTNHNHNNNFQAWYCKIDFPKLFGIDP